jgi:D-alanine-D-alanine ligase
VSVNSHVENIQGVNQLGGWISTRFQRLQFNRQVYPHTEVGNALYFRNHDQDQNDVLILGHLDTVYRYRDHVPFADERGRLYGSGVAESKGGIAITLVALQALRFARVLRKIRCGVLLTTDNTLGGRFSGRLVTDLAGKSRFVIGTKYGDPGGTCVSSCSGSREYHIDLTHPKRDDRRLRTDLITSLARKSLAWQRLSSAERGVHIIINALEAQTNRGRVADHAGVTITARFVSREQSVELDRAIRAIAKRGANGSLEVQIRSGGQRLPVLETDPSRRFLEAAREIAQQLEVNLESIHRGIPSDICQVPEGIPVLDGFGPIGAEVRSPGEYIIRDSLIDRSALLALLTHGCARSPAHPDAVATCQGAGQEA